MVNLKIFDMLGREVQTLVNENMSPGTYEYTFEAGRLQSGIYFYRLETQSYTLTRKMVLIK